MSLSNCSIRKDATCRNQALRLLSMARVRGLDTRVIRRALEVAAQAHINQVRRSGEPFVAHPLAVALAVLQLGGGSTEVVTALMHDVLEDCDGITVEHMFQRFGPDIATRLVALTKRSEVPKALRVGEAHGRLITALDACGAGLALVKLLDRAHNAATSAVLTPERLQRMHAENHCLFAPLAAHVGALGLADFLVAQPSRWWQAAADFPAQIRRIQVPLAIEG